MPAYKTFLVLSLPRAKAHEPVTIESGFHATGEPKDNAKITFELSPLPETRTSSFVPLLKSVSEVCVAMEIAQMLF